jgi:iron complex outermembrane receptor protein
MHHRSPAFIFDPSIPAKPMNSRTAFRFKPSALAQAAALTTLVLSGSAALAQANDEQPRPKDDSTRLGTIVIQGSGDRLGAGLMLNEDAVKARSTVTKASTEKDRSTSNLYQSMTLLPGINSYNHDATGLFGGGITVRGFNSDQLGLAVNGVPVNDSGSYSVFPQEYADGENLCTLSVAPGNPDVDSPHIGATGGGITVTSCDPSDTRRTRVSATVGQLQLRRIFVRGDSGRFLNDKAKVFLSVSHTTANKWKGPGSAKKDHIDAAFSYDLDADNRILGSVLYNKALNNNIGNLSLTQLNNFGYNYDYSPTFTPGHLTPTAGKADVETGPSPQFYKLSVNPFENAIVSVSGSFKLPKDIYLKVQPYLWYGFGTGGNQQAVLSESAFFNAATRTNTGKADLNGDGDTLDRVLVARSSVTKTSRPGVTAELSSLFGSHSLKGGLWFERADHRQTQPAVPVDANGNPTDIWLQTGQILRPDGTTYQGRDWKSITPAYQAYVSDQFSFQGDHGLLQLGLRAPHTSRKFTNYADEGNGGSAAAQYNYTIDSSYSAVLPQLGLRYQLTREHQFFGNVGKNFRAPPNFAFAPTSNNVQVVNGVPTLVTPVKAETSVVTDLGYRYQTRIVSLSLTAYNVDFKDRQANAYDPILDKSVYTNAGSVNNKGIEVEAGTAPIAGFTFYGSFTAQKSKILSDITVTKGQVVPTTGKAFPLTPERMWGLSMQYDVGPFYARLKAKHTSHQWATLMNDEEVPTYNVIDLDLGYKLGSLGFVKDASLKFNLSNLLDAKYRNPSSGTTVNAKAVGTTAASTVFYYLGAPRFASATLQADF